MKCVGKNLERAGITGLSKSEPPAVENPIDDHADLLPEFCVYRDEGCELAKSCLNCPFPRCVDDEPRGRKESSKALRNKEIFRLYTREKLSVKELAVRFNVTRNTVYSVLKADQEG